MRFLLLLGLGLALAGCDEGDSKRQAVAQEKGKKDSDERTARIRAARGAEQKLMNESPMLTLDKRINEWISVRDGMYVFRGSYRQVRTVPSKKFDAWHAVPITVPWFVKCDDGGINVTLGPWIEARGHTGESVDSESMFGVELSDAKLTDEQCALLVTVVARDILRLSSGK